ncbi:MAG: hypothetical protein R2711_12105 [Acidimicrobiales bacterium]
MRSLHGVHVHGFPNLLLIGFSQAANLVSNVTHNLVDAGTTIAAVIAHALEVGAVEVEATAEAEQAWIDLLGSGGQPQFLADCTPATTTTRASLTIAVGACSAGTPAGRWRSSPSSTPGAGRARRGPRPPARACSGLTRRGAGFLRGSDGSAAAALEYRPHRSRPPWARRGRER